MWSLSSPASAGCHLCLSPRWCFFLQGVEGTASKFIPLAKRGGRLAAINTLRQWKFDVVHIYKYHFCAWPLSTDTCQVLHAIWVRDKVQMLVLNEKVTTPKPPCLVWGTGSTGMWTHLPPGRITANSTQMWPHAPRVPIRMAGVSFSWKKVVCSPSAASRSQGRAVHVEGSGLVIRVTFLPH